MPKHNITLVQLPAEKPDCCAVCPLCGLVPQAMRPKGSKETHVCLATMEALSGRGIRVRASLKDANHKWHRPCDSRWEAMMQLPGRKFGVANQVFIQCRVPFEQAQQFVIKFHK